MMALTLHQPWATLIALGYKTCETRSWAAAHKYWDNVIAIHAGQVEDRDFRWNDPKVISLMGDEPTPKGAIVAIARLKDCVPAESCWPSSLEDHVGDFSPGRFTCVQPMTQPVPCRGRQKLWTVPPQLVPVIMERAGPAVALDPHP